jgi:hypothetical protein
LCDYIHLKGCEAMSAPKGIITRSRASPFTQTPQSGRSQNRRVSNMFTPKAIKGSSFAK